MRARGAVVALVALLGLAACGSSTGGRTGVATNPADLPNGGALVSGTPGGATGTPGVQTSGVRTVLAPLGLNLRSADSSTSQVLGTVAQGTLFTVIGYSANGNGWYHVKGDTTTGWITANPQFSSPHQFQSYQSSTHGFSALYLQGWNFSDDSTAAVFRPQQGGGQAIVVTTAATLDQLGPAGQSGYTLASTDTVEVFGVTANLRVYSRTGQPSPGGPDSPPPLAHLAELRFTIDSQRAMRIDFGYDDSGLLPQFADFYNSVSFAPPATPGPSASPGASPTPLPSGATPTPL